MKFIVYKKTEVFNFGFFVFFIEINYYNPSG